MQLKERKKRMLIATVQDHYSTIAILLNLLVLHCELPLKAIQKKISSCLCTDKIISRNINI